MVVRLCGSVGQTQRKMYTGRCEYDTIYYGQCDWLPVRQCRMFFLKVAGQGIKLAVNIENTRFICPAVGAGQVRDRMGQDIEQVSVRC